MTATTDRGRITARVPYNVQDILERAAAIVGTPLNQFLVQSALKEAHEIIEREQIVHLSKADMALVYSLLENPVPANPALQEALADYRKRMLDDSHSTIDWAPQ